MDQDAGQHDIGEGIVAIARQRPRCESPGGAVFRYRIAFRALALGEDGRLPDHEIGRAAAFADVEQATPGFRTDVLCGRTMLLHRYEALRASPGIASDPFSLVCREQAVDTQYIGHERGKLPVSGVGER